MTVKETAARRPTRHAGTKPTCYSEEPAWHRLMRWTRAKYKDKHRLGMAQFRRRFCDQGWRIAHHGAVFTGASSVPVTRYHYRGSTIATPWTPTPATTTTGS